MLRGGGGRFYGIDLLLTFTAPFHKVPAPCFLSFQVHVAGLRRKASLGLRWVRDVCTANAADVLPRCRTPSPAGGGGSAGA